jgi:hypothetical protein
MRNIAGVNRFDKLKWQLRLMVKLHQNQYYLNNEDWSEDIIKQNSNKEENRIINYRREFSRKN